LAFGSCLYSEHYVFAQTDQTASKLQAANTSVEQAFNAVLAAEKAGANVTNLLNQLNGASDLLAQAENVYRIGDNNKAANDADAVLPIAQQVTAVAQTAQGSVSASIQAAVFPTVAFTVEGAVVFVLVLFLVWSWFKRRYIKSLSDAKPEVSSQ
jgi:predicted PurR-regulated permease PerM